VLGARACEPTQILQTAGEPIARALELGEVEQARPRRGLPARSRTAAAGRGDIGERVHDDLRELALEPGDLRLQRGACRQLGGGCLSQDTVASAAAVASAAPDPRGDVDAAWRVPIY